MEVWTPPVVVGPELQDAGHLPVQAWRLTREHSQHAPLSLVRPDGVALTIDFTTGKTRHRTTESGKGAQALSKALGVRAYVKTHGHYPRIIDATGGLGQDAWALASLGCTLIIIERHPVVYALLDDALARALRDPECTHIARRLNLEHGDATKKIALLITDDTSAIYLDPMYPDRRKKAYSKKGMQFLHALLGPPPDDDPTLLVSAINAGVPRVVVKRPKGAALLAGTGQFTGQRTVINSPNTRYDVYHCRPRSLAGPQA